MVSEQSRRAPLVAVALTSQIRRRTQTRTARSETERDCGGVWPSLALRRPTLSLAPNALPRARSTKLCSETGGDDSHERVRERSREREREREEGGRGRGGPRLPHAAAGGVRCAPRPVGQARRTDCYSGALHAVSVPAPAQTSKGEGKTAHYHPPKAQELRLKSIHIQRKKSDKIVKWHAPNLAPFQENNGVKIFLQILDWGRRDDAPTVCCNSAP